ncbi:MAG: PPC domain-containing protein, partial [Cyanobacteria bacterium J06558_2]
MKLTNWVWGIVVGLVLSANLPVMAIAPGIVKGRLDGNSATLNDVSFFDVYSFEGEAGESVFIELNSEEFDAVLGLLDPEGNEIAQNDDGEEGKNAQIFIVLPTTGRYDIIVAAFEKQFGSYRLSWRDASAIEVKQAKADELLQQGNQQFRVSQ